MDFQASTEYLYFLVSTGHEELSKYASFINCGLEAQEEELYEYAELQFRAALGFAETLWGPYSWLAAHALRPLFENLELQGRFDEARVVKCLYVRLSSTGSSGLDG